MSEFNPKQYMIDLKGKKYLQTNARVAWFRTEQPRGTITTEVLSMDPVLVKATVCDEDGHILGIDHAGAKPQQGAVWAGRDVEKACTAAIGRALALAGYGTLAALDEDNADGNLADAPVERRQNRPADAQNGATTPPQGGDGHNGSRVVNTPLNDRGPRRVTTEEPTKPRDRTPIWEATKQHFKAREHFDHLLAKLVSEGKVTAAMTNEQVIAAIHANREAEGKADKGWFNDAKTMRDLNAYLFQDHVLTLEQAVAKVGRLDAFPSMKAFLGAVADALKEPQDKQPAGAF